MTNEEVLFNYRLSRKRCVTENLFGIWINRFRIFTNMSNLVGNRASMVLMTTLVLHNLLIFKPRDSYTSKDYVDEIQSNRLKDGGSKEVEKQL